MRDGNLTRSGNIDTKTAKTKSAVMQILDNSGHKAALKPFNATLIVKSATMLLPTQCDNETLTYATRLQS